MHLHSSSLFGLGLLLVPSTVFARAPGDVAAPAAEGTAETAPPYPAASDPAAPAASSTAASSTAAPTPAELGTTEDNPPKIVFSTAPLPAPNGGDSSRTFHFHDGFYARLGVQYGLTGGGFSIGDTTIDYFGSQLSLDLLIGGTPSDGLAVGGGVLLGSLLQPDMEVGGANIATRNVPLLVLGPFIDGFFSPQGGWHAGALLGLGALGKTPETEGSAGIGASVWFGYDKWVGDDWSIGGQIRFLGIAAGGNKPEDFSSSALGVNLGFSVLYH
jgi:hypothetical protein